MSELDRRDLVKGAVAALVATASCGSGIAQATSRSQNSANHEVIIENFGFHPAVMVIAPGDMITWINHDFVPHTATAVDKSWDTGSIAKGRSVTIRFTLNTSAKYFCRFHPHMTAALRTAS